MVRFFVPFMCEKRNVKLNCKSLLWSLCLLTDQCCVCISVLVTPSSSPRRAGASREREIPYSLQCTTPLENDSYWLVMYHTCLKTLRNRGKDVFTLTAENITLLSFLKRERERERERTNQLWTSQETFQAFSLPFQNWSICSSTSCVMQFLCVSCRFVRTCFLVQKRVLVECVGAWTHRVLRTMRALRESTRVFTPQTSPSWCV